MLIFRMFGFLFGKRSHLYLHNFYLHSLGNNKHIQRILRFLMNSRKVTLIAQTPNEVQFYRRLSDKIHLEFVPYCSDTQEEANNVGTEGYVFTGGYTNRDYPLMVQLAQAMPNKDFLIVASNLNNDLQDVPSNVKLLRNISLDEFAQRMKGAGVVVVPLKEDTGSSGQMLCIQAMRFHKPIVYANVSSINYYFAPDSGMPYEIGSLPSLQNALKVVLKNPEQSRTMGEKAYQESLKYTKENGFEMIEKIILKQ